MPAGWLAVFSFVWAIVKGTGFLAIGNDIACARKRLSLVRFIANNSRMQCEQLAMIKFHAVGAALGASLLVEQQEINYLHSY